MKSLALFLFASVAVAQTINPGVKQSPYGTGSAGVATPTPTNTNIVCAITDSQSTYNLPCSPMVNPMTTKGDIIIGDTSGVPTRLAAGTSGFVLTSNGAGAFPSWQAGGGGGSGNYANLCGVVTLTNATCSSGAIVPNASVTNFTMSAIPGTYLSLILTCQARSSAAAAGVTMGTTLNSDTGSNYDLWGLQANTSAGVLNEFGLTSWSLWDVTAASSTANYPSGGQLILPFYASTTFYKQGIGTNGMLRSASGGSTWTYRADMWWRSTAAITSITETLTSGNYVTGSQCTLYGAN